MTASLPAKLADRIELWDVAELRPYAGNPREHSSDQVRRIASSISEFGFVNPILVDRQTREIVAGHGRLQAAALLGLPKVPVVPLDHLTESQRRAYLIADNRLGELSTWNEEKLKGELAKLSAELPALPELGFDAGKMRRLLAPSRPSPSSVDEAHAIEVPSSRPTTRSGDVWAIGDQRLVCGDNGLEETLALALRGEPVDCVVTDPPYAIYGSSTGVGSDVADDRMVGAFFERVLRSIVNALRVNGHAYVFCDWRSWATWWEAGRRVQHLSCHNMIVWDKGSAGLGSNWANTHELVGFWQRRAEKTKMFGRAPAGVRTVNRSNVIRANRTGQTGFEREHEDGEREHNAAKPVDLLREFVCASTDTGERVLDLFGGSGSTLLACEITRRRGVAIEVEPKWCDLTVRRLERLTEKQAVLEGDGRAFAEIAGARAAELERPARAPRARGSRSKPKDSE